MYLMMLLATYLSAIYGYNLSFRPEFDRDVARKKAAAVVYKLSYHHGAIYDYVYARARSNNSHDWVFPEDMIFSVHDPDDTDEYVSKISYNSNVADTSDVDELDLRGTKYLPAGHALFKRDMAVSKIMCLENKLQMYDDRYDKPDKPAADAPVSCVVPVDGDNNPTGSCCSGKIGAYVITYRKIDPRWVNRVTNKVSSDMLWAIGERPFNYNIGMITWNGTNWDFQGKIFFEPVYYFDREQFLEENGQFAYYPRAKMRRTSWAMPPRVFPQNYFTSTDGTPGYCNDGCLIRIQRF